MPMIANYYAQVGVQIDQSSAAKVTRYLNGIKRQMASFQSQLAKTSEVNLKVNIDAKKSMVGLNRSLRALSSGVSLTVRNVNFSKSELLKSLNMAISGSHGRTNLRIGALLSQESLNGMRAQLRASINSLVVSPTIRPNVIPRVRRGSAAGTVEGGGYSRRSMGGLSPFSKRGMNPWYNPMMIGGGLGAFIRYGAYSLPFVAGAMGLNTLSNAGERIQNAYMAVRAQVGDPALAAQQLSFLEALGHNHGIRVADMAPGYSQMFAASQGTVLQNYIPKGFQNFIQYGSVIGMNEEQKKGAILALSQIIGKGGRGFAQELNLQLTNQGMPNARRLFAEAVAGGDMKKFEDMMQKGEVGLEGVMKFLNLLGEKAAPFLPQYYSTITAQRGRVGYATEQYTKEFMDAGGSRAIAGFYSTLRQVIADATPYAKDIAEYFEKAARAARVLLLVPGEVKDWFSGVENSKNFMQVFLGKSSESEFLDVFRSTFATMESISKSTMEQIRLSISPVRSEIYGLLSFITDALKGLNLILNLVKGYNDSGISGLTYAHRQNQAQIQAEKMAQAEAEKIKSEHGITLPMSAIMQRRKDIYSDLMKDVPPPGQSTSGFSFSNIDQWAVNAGAATREYIQNIWNSTPNMVQRSSMPSLPTESMPSPYIYNSAQVPSNTPILSVPSSSEGVKFIVVDTRISGNIDVNPGEVFSSSLHADVQNASNKAIEDAIRGFFPATGGSVIGGRPQ